MKQKGILTQIAQLLIFLFLVLGVSCKNEQDEIDDSKSELNSHKELLNQLEEAQDEAKVIIQMVKLIDKEGRGWKLIFTDGTSIRLDDTILINQDDDTISITMPDEAVFVFNMDRIKPRGGLPIIYLSTPNGRKITSKDEWIDECILEVLTDDGSANLYLTDVLLRGRGNSTWGYPKKPYAIKLNKKTELLGMPAHRRWILLANWMDKTLLRNSLAFELSRKTELAYTPRGVFVDLVFNGEFVGNYYLCEHIKIDPERVNIAELDNSDYTMPTITGGYLIELDVNYDEINKFTTDVKSLPVNIKEPDEDDLNDAQFDYIKDYLNNIENILYASGEGAYEDYIDTKSFIDWLLVHELTGNVEPHHPKSCFMHKDRNGKLVAGPVWDFDWGTFIPGYSGFINASKIWYDKLLDDEAFRAELKERWNMLKPEFQSVSAFIDEQADYIRQSALANSEIWPITLEVNGDESMSFDEAVVRLKDTYEQRIQSLDSLINE